MFKSHSEWNLKFLLTEGTCPKYIPGDIEGPTASEELYAADVSKEECIDICKRARSENAEVVGATISVTGGRCYCEMNGNQVKPNFDYLTCYLPSNWV